MGSPDKGSLSACYYFDHFNLHLSLDSLTYFLGQAVVPTSVIYYFL